MLELDMSSICRLVKIVVFCGAGALSGCDDGAAKPDAGGPGGSCDTLRFPDDDGDSFGDSARGERRCGATGWVNEGGDCDDRDANRYPGATEQCDGTDNNCDGTVDDSSVVDGSYWFTDADGDGWGTGAPLRFSCEGATGEADNDDDCDDASAASAPDAAEICDGLDNDCDGEVDEGEVEDGLYTLYEDADGDGWGDEDVAYIVCGLMEGRTETPGDCDDLDASTYPGAEETCDGIDHDCDGFFDNRCMTPHTSEDASATFLHPETATLLANMVGTDLTGDSKDDLLVAYSERFVGLLETPLSADSEFVWTAEPPDDSIYFGSTMSAQADLNGDGNSDLAMPYFPYVGADRTAEILVMYGPLLDAPDWSTPSTSLTAGEPVYLPGLSGMSTADLNGDDQKDLIFASTEDGGTMFIWHTIGEADATLDDTISWPAPREDHNLGPQTGDINGDGSADIVHGVLSRHQLAVLLGPIAGVDDTEADRIVEDGTESRHLDDSLCIADFDGDGADDIGVGTTQASDPPPQPTELWVYAPMDEADAPLFKITAGEVPQAALYSCRDVDGDGQTDVLVQQYAASDEDGDAVGAVRLFFGPMTGTISEDDADHEFIGDEDMSLFGYQTVSMDHDDDGHMDLLISGVYADLMVFSSEDWLSPWWGTD